MKRRRSINCNEWDWNWNSYHNLLAIWFRKQQSQYHTDSCALQIANRKANSSKTRHGSLITWLAWRPGSLTVELLDPAENEMKTTQVSIGILMKWMVFNWQSHRIWPRESFVQHEKVDKWSPFFSSCMLAPDLYCCKSVLSSCLLFLSSLVFARICLAHKTKFNFPWELVEILLGLASLTDWVFIVVDGL